MSDQPTDAQLIAASRFDGVHFITVFDRHGEAVHRYLDRRVGRDVAQAQVGEAFATAFSARRHVRPWGESARPWLLGVATNVVRKQWRIELAQLHAHASRRGAARRADAPDGVDADPDAAATVADRLVHLDARDRDVLLLAAWESLGADAVARALDLPDGVVSARLEGLAREIADPERGDEPADPGTAVAEGLRRVQALRPDIDQPDPDVLASVRDDLLVLAGCAPTAGSRRPTSTIAAEHEQLRRWRSGPGTALASRRSRT